MVMPTARTRPHELASTGTANEVQLRLSAIEWKVLDRVRRGLTTEAIARELHLTDGTVELHVKHSLRKLSARSRDELLLRTARWH